jgi:hypothetical protein
MPGVTLRQAAVIALTVLLVAGAALASAVAAGWLAASTAALLWSVGLTSSVLCTEDAVIVLDDTGRKAEKALSDRWLAEAGA